MGSEAVVDDKGRQKRAPCKSGHRYSRWQLVGLGVLVVAIVSALVFLPVAQWLRIAVMWTTEWGWMGKVLFAILYAIAATLALPVTPLNIGSGVLFGWWMGFLLAMAGSLGAAVLSFVLARFLLQNWVRHHLACYSTPAAIIEDVHERPWSAIITLRLHPFVPALVKNYCFGISDVRISIYLAATAIAYSPVVFLYSYLGAAGYMTVEHERDWTTLESVLYSLGLVGALALTILLTWYGKKRIDDVKQRHMMNVE